MQLTPADIPVAALRDAARRPDVVAAVRDLYAQADRRIAEHAPTCWNKGECCRFGEFGHRLYVTALEVVCYLAAGDDVPDGGDPHQDRGLLPIVGDACPHAREGRCRARSRRPLGCRVFYCDPAASHWQGPLTEELLAELRQLHARLEVPYFYAEWLTVLEALGHEPA